MQFVPAIRGDHRWLAVFGPQARVELDVVLAARVGRKDDRKLQPSKVKLGGAKGPLRARRVKGVLEQDVEGRAGAHLPDDKHSRRGEDDKLEGKKGEMDATTAKCRFFKTFFRLVTWNGVM